MYFMNQFDMKNETNILVIRVVFMAIHALIFAALGLIYLRIQSRNLKATVTIS